ncbi:MAG: AAA family ATPase [Armatimonadota bacterium]|nr:AAA family ATPase [Armatimonadota bacterium]
MHLKSATFDPERYPTTEHYPFNLPVLRPKTTLEFTDPVTLFVGENGSGKSTVLRALARRCGIHMWRHAPTRRARHNPYEDRLGEFISIEWRAGSVPGSYFASEVFNDFAMILDEWATEDAGQLKYFGGESLLTQSHGESLMSFFEARYQVRGLHFLDEPETALAPSTQLELLKLLAEMSCRGHAQFIIATHSPIILACPMSTLLSFDGGSIHSVAYEDTEHYRVYRDFMAAPASYVAEL